MSDRHRGPGLTLVNGYGLQLRGSFFCLSHDHANFLCLIFLQYILQDVAHFIVFKVLIGHISPFSNKIRTKTN